MTVLLEKYELREAYTQGFKGMYFQADLFYKVLKLHMPKVEAHLTEMDMRPEMLLCDWVLSFHCSNLPLSKLPDFFDQFF